ncbi:MAG: hypothetical protein FGM46_06270 [Ferruginibacter sp.]|nr:hypothetical protein [Ferruginibacter sp.]
MKISEFKISLEKLSQLNFVQPNGNFVPRHFHITEAGLTTKQFIDCGGTVRLEKNISFQIWVANDFEHRLEVEKFRKIIDLSTPLFGNEDLEVEVEYQSETISRYAIDFNGHHFVMVPKQTDCLAKDHCGIPNEKLKVNLSEIKTQNSCKPGQGCC